MANRRWTMDELNRMDAIEFAMAVLQERSNGLTNGYAPLGVKLDQTIVELGEIRTKLEISGKEGYVVDNKGKPVRIFLNVLDYFRYIDQSYISEFGEKHKTPFIKPVMPENGFIKRIVSEDQFRFNGATYGETYTRVIPHTSFDDPDALPIYVRDRTLRREVYQVFTEKDEISGGYKAESKFTFKTWGEAENYIKEEKQRIKNSTGK